VCQPTVPVLAAISLMAARGETTPRTLILMGGPVDARVNPTAVNVFATEKTHAWFEKNMIHRVPANHAGAGRAVYPGFIQLTAFVMMNPTRHLDAYRNYWLDQVRGVDSADGARVHERFYNEYNAVLDMDAAYYLDTVRTVFQDFALAQGTWEIAGERVRPEAITTTALYTIEGALDDISGLGQTQAAHGLCAGIAADRKRHQVAADCGHYGLFSGHRWRETIYPTVRDFVRTHAAEVVP
jgi:poly(3-hydroxybutyrate) depolymerase